MYIILFMHFHTSPIWWYHIELVVTGCPCGDKCGGLTTSPLHVGPIFANILYINWPVIDQSHRYGRPRAACREPAGSYDKTTRTAICFEHKTQYLLIRAPYTHIVVFWHISNIPPMISQSQISCNTPTFYKSAIFVKYCFTTGSWLL